MHTNYNFSDTHSGFTLIELIIALVVLAIGAITFTTLVNQATLTSVDPVLRVQANSIARSYLEEVSLRSFCDPDISTDCPADCNSGLVCTTCSENTGGLETRSTFDDVCDYNGLNDIGAVSQSGPPGITGLENYNVLVTVDDGTDLTDAVLNTLSSANQEVVRIDVDVTHATNSSINISVSGYRANY
jgi:MSHA pilin protein MshD